MCLVFLLAAYGIRYYKEKDIAKMLVFIVLGLVAVVLFKEDIKEVFQTKIDDYSGYGDLNTTISKIQVRNIKEIYKLPFSYAFAMIQPFTQSYFGESELSFWAHTIAKLNVSIFPVAIGSLIYVIKKKDDWFYWIITFIMYASIISLSIGISRHYLFLIPIEMINYSLFLKDEPKGSQYRMVVALGSILLFLVILFKEVLT